MVIKVLLIAESLYSSYLFLFLFDNATSYFVYTKDELYIGDINKSLKHKQLYLYNG